MSYLKIRANLANIGNATSAYRTNYYMESVGTTINNAAQYWRGNTLRNPDLKPEAISTQEIGLEAAFWKNRIRLDLAYYHKETTDQIMTVQMPSSTGYYYKLINAGKVTNSGVEISLSADILLLCPSATEREHFVEGRPDYRYRTGHRRTAWCVAFRQHHRYRSAAR
jgi:outer membrane cobalamin receptor